MSWAEGASNPFTIVDARRIQMSSSHLSRAEILQQEMHHNAIRYIARCHSRCTN